MLHPPDASLVSQEGETHAERLARVRTEHLRKTATLAREKGKGRRAAQRERKRKRVQQNDKPEAGGEALPKASKAPKVAAHAEKRRARTD